MGSADAHLKEEKKRKRKRNRCITGQERKHRTPCVSAGRAGRAVVLLPRSRLFTIRRGKKEGRRKEDEGRRREYGRRKMWKKERHTSNLINHIKIICRNSTLTETVPLFARPGTVSDEGGTRDALWCAFG